MVQPLNYIISKENPLTAGLRGYRQGVAQRQAQQQLGMQQQGVQQRQQQIDLQKQQQQSQIQQAQRLQARKLQMQKDLAEFANSDRMEDDYNRILAKYPEMAKGIDSIYENYTEEQKKADIEQSLQIWSALYSGNVDVAKDLMEEELEAAKNSGDEQREKELSIALQTLEQKNGVKAATVAMEMPLYRLIGKDFIEMKDSLSEDLGKSTGKGAKTVKSEIFKDGSVLQVLSNQDVVFKNAMGEVLKAKDAEKAIKKARKYGSELARKINYSRKRGSLIADKELKASIERMVTEERESVKGEIGRYDELIDKGINAAESIPTLKRALSLLEEIETGDFRGALIKAKQKFGIAGADEEELSTNLSLSAIKNIRTLLGSQFTEGENRQIQNIYQKIGKGRESNYRLVQQTYKIAENIAKRALRSARKRKDTFAIEDINDAMNLDLTPEETPPEETPPEETPKAKNREIKNILDEIRKKWKNQ